MALRKDSSQSASLVKALVGAGADINARARWPFDASAAPPTYTPLHYSVDYRCIADGQLVPWPNILALLENGADMEAKDLYGKMAVHFACQIRWAALNVLIRHNSSQLKARGGPQAQGWTPLYYAMMKNQPYTVNYLLDAVANIGARVRYNDEPKSAEPSATALHVADERATSVQC